MGKAKEGFEVDMMRLIDKVEALAIFWMEEEMPRSLHQDSPSH